MVATYARWLRPCCMVLLSYLLELGMSSRAYNSHIEPTNCLLPICGVVIDVRYPKVINYISA
jgi:hypothetical protein